MREWVRRPIVTDGAVAIALTVWNQWELTRAEFLDGAVALNHLTFAVITLSVGLRRIAPLACASVAAAGLTAQTLWGGDVFGAAAQFVALLIATHAAGSHPDAARRWVGLVVILIGVECIVFVDDEIVLADEVGNIAVFVAVWALAAAVRAGEDRRAAQAADQDRREREAVENERSRVARELHDIVAHGLSLMVLHAGAARTGGPTSSDAVQRSLRVVEESGRQAMTELHRLLGMLSGRDEPPDAMAGLADIDGLCDHMRNAGLTVELERRPVASVDRSVELSAYRIVQEALTNALRYARDGRVVVSVAPNDGRLEIVVRDHRPRGSRAPVPAVVLGSGSGLRGLRERVSLFGGSFEAGAQPDGWEVRATLPLAGAP